MLFLASVTRLHLISKDNVLLAENVYATICACDLQVNEMTLSNECRGVCHSYTVYSHEYSTRMSMSQDPNTHANLESILTRNVVLQGYKRFE